MKSIYLILLFLFPFCILAQESDIFGKTYNPSAEEVQIAIAYIPLQEGKIVYQESLPYSSDKMSAYTSLKRWFVDNFPSIQNIIQIDDPQKGSLVAKSVRQYRFKSGVNRSDFSMFFTIGMEVATDTVHMKVYNIYGSDKRRNNLLMYLDATNAMLNDNNFNQHNSVEKFDIDVSRSYYDYLEDKKKRFNGRLLYTIDTEIKEIFESARHVLK